MLLLLLSATGLFVTGQTEADSVAGTEKEVIELSNINYELDKVEKSFKKMEDILKPDSRVLFIDSTFSKYRGFLESQANEFRAYNPYNLSKFFLENSYRLWEGFSIRLTGWQSEVNNRLATVQDDIDQLDKTIHVWQITNQSEELQEEADELNQRILQIIEKADQYRVELSKKKRSLIILEDQIAQANSFCADIIAEILQLQQNQRDSLFIAITPPLWDVSVTRADYAPVDVRINKWRHENAKILRNYFLTQSLRPLLIWSIFLVILFFILRNSYLKKKFDDSYPGHKHIIRIFVKHPLTTLVSLILVSFHLFFPYYPLVLNHILTLLLLINMRYILSEFIDRSDKHFIFRLIILLAINDIEIIFWYFGDVARFYIAFEALLGLFLAYKYIKPANWYNFSELYFVKKTKVLLALFIFLFYAVAFVANLRGYLDFAVLMTKVGIHVPEFTVVLYGVYLIVVAMVRAIVRVGKAGKISPTSIHWDRFEKQAIRVSGILGVLYWIYSFTVSFEVSRVIFDSITEFLVKERSVGTMELTIGSILALVLILIGTFLLAGLIKLLVEPVILKHTKLPRGVPAAISVTIRYFLIILGFMFALSAAGIELGKFSLLAGALGVGIGFGLQNIVNNFISGLILVYERPLQVGDTIEVDKLLGQVKRIGIRSSNVRTYDGAEVVVPNGNLVSNQLINWTLSDKTRRIEIKVGVSYGSDLNVVLKLLEKVAGDHEDVLKEPAPWALFEEFGNSSLNFRLLFWVPYELGIKTKSEVAVALFNIFRENGVEIPFPQLDLHVKEEKQKKELSEEEIRALETGKRKTENQDQGSSKTGD